MTAAFTRVPDLAAQHLLLSLAALLIGLAVALPLAVWSARSARVAHIALGFASFVQTIPSLALLALFYPLLLALSGLIGGGIPALGFLPAVAALALYALLPILRNAVTGLANLDPAIVEAADAIGMTPAQKLRLVEAPLVAPVLMAGIRTAAVWTIGAATLATTVGQPSLGDLIFSGLQTQNWNLVLAGCIAAAALALAVDALLGVIERAIRDRRPRRGWIALAMLGIAVVAALFNIVPRGDARETVTIGAKNFSEQFILARLIGDRLEQAGYAVRYREGLGSSVAFAALAGGDIQVYVEYAGTIWGSEMGRGDVVPDAAMLAAIERWTATRGVRVAGPLGFENAYAFAMKRAEAERRGIRTLDDLARTAPGLAFGSDLEFLDRPEWAAVRDAYRLRFASQTAYNPSFMYRAIDSGRADVISAFSSDGRIAAQDLVVLDDPRGAIPGYDALLLVHGDAAFVETLRPLVGRIPVEAMRAANYMVDRDSDKRTPEAAARWLSRRTAL